MNPAVRYEEFRGKMRIVTAGRTGGIKRATTGHSIVQASDHFYTWSSNVSSSAAEASESS
jgi:hypothetical protein